jgi:hypothetical protein
MRRADASSELRTIPRTRHAVVSAMSTVNPPHQTPSLCDMRPTQTNEHAVPTDNSLFIGKVRSSDGARPIPR